VVAVQRVKFGALLLCALIIAGCAAAKGTYARFDDEVEQRLRRLGAALIENNLYIAVAEVEELQERLTTALREASFLEEVALPAYLPTKATMVLLRRPLYRAVFERFLEFHREAYVQLDEPRLDAPLDNLPHLYETWGALNVMAAALKVGEELGFETRLQRIARHTNHSVFVRVLPDGEPALVMAHPDDGREISVVPQRSFGRTAKPFRSISFPQRPDLTLEISIEAPTWLSHAPGPKIPERRP
jgi:PD-(D/E)XK nuclease superfamily